MHALLGGPAHARIDSSDDASSCNAQHNRNNYKKKKDTPWHFTFRNQTTL